MSDTVFVTMFHPALGNVQVQAPLQAVSTYEEHGWLLLDPNATPPPVPTPYLTQAAADSRYLRDWLGGEVLTAGTPRLSPDGHLIIRTADGTTRSTYDTTEQAAWTSVGGVSSVAGRAGAVVLTAGDVSGLAPVATSGVYTDLTSRPGLGSANGVATLDGGGTVPDAQIPARLQDTALRAAYVAKVAAPSGVAATDRAAIQAAIAAAVSAGGGRVLLAPGATYLVNMVVHPADNTIGCALLLDSGVQLDLNGSTIKLANSQGLPTGIVGVTTDGSAQLHIISVARPRSNATAAQYNISVVDGIIDGNAANQTLDMSGLLLARTRSAWVSRVKVKNCHGSASSPPAETFHFEALNCTDVHYSDCEAVCDDASSTATGFSADNSTNISWISCVAQGMTHGMGFTHWQSGVLRYVSCHAYSNAGYGFNTERSEDVAYSACSAGLRSAPVASALPGPFWSSVGQSAPNGFGGFCCQGSVVVSYANCTARYNTADGLQIKDNTAASPTIVSDSITVIGGQYGPGNGRGFEIASTATNVDLRGARSTGNTAVDLIPNGTADVVSGAYSGSPFVTYTSVNNSGVRFNVVGYNGGTPGNGYRWYTNGALALQVNLDTSAVFSSDVSSGRALRTARYATGSRPAASLGIGFQVYDTTLLKPIWSDGTNWKDAMGNIV